MYTVYGHSHCKKQLQEVEGKDGVSGVDIIGVHPLTDGAPMRSRGENRKMNSSNDDTSQSGSSSTPETGGKSAFAEGKQGTAVQGGVAAAPTSEEEETAWYESIIIVVVRLIVYVMMLVVPRWIVFPGEKVSSPARIRANSEDASGNGVQHNFQEAKDHFAAVRRFASLSSRMDHASLHLRCVCSPTS
jgi:hypothetical protein